MALVKSFLVLLVFSILLTNCFVYVTTEKDACYVEQEKYQSNCDFWITMLTASYIFSQTNNNINFELNNEFVGFYCLEAYNHEEKCKGSSNYRPGIAENP